MLGIENTLKAYDTEEEKQQQYKEGELVFPKGYLPYVHHSDEYIRKNMSMYQGDQ